MKKKIFNLRIFPVFLSVLALAAPGALFAGAVKTKDGPRQCGGYHGGSYHLKCKGEKKNYVDRDQNMKNPFKGFTNTGGKPKKQGSMPHSQ